MQEWTRDRSPLDWAHIQHNLGLTLWTIGTREVGTARLEEAVAAFRELLEERSRERAPLDWATTVGAQGVTLLLIAQRTDDAITANTATQQIEVAVDAAAGNAVGAEYYHEQLAKAHALTDELSGHITH